MISLRESLATTITELQAAIDYWSEQHIRGKSGYDHYIFLVKELERIKQYVLEVEHTE